VLFSDTGQVSRMKKIRSWCWKELHVFKGVRRRLMRWPGKVVYLEQGFRRKLMKRKMFLSEISNQDEVIPSSAGKRGKEDELQL
jgi:hypothetical protein